MFMYMHCLVQLLDRSELISIRKIVNLPTQHGVSCLVGLVRPADLEGAARPRRVQGCLDVDRNKLTDALNENRIEEVQIQIDAILAVVSLAHLYSDGVSPQDQRPIGVRSVRMSAIPDRVIVLGADVEQGTPLLNVIASSTCPCAGEEDDDDGADSSPKRNSAHSLVK